MQTAPGLVSRAGTLLLRELTVDTGLAAGWTEALLDTCKAAPSVHLPGRVLADLAVMLADGGDALAHLAVLRDQRKLSGAVASEATAWRAAGGVGEEHLERLRQVRAAARERAWAAGVGPDVTAGLTIGMDAAITIAHSEKENSAATRKRTYGFHPLLAYLDRPDVPGGEALAGLLRPGNAGSNIAAGHVTVLDMALAALPERARPRPGDPASPKVLVRTSAAGATHQFAAALRARGCGFSLGFAVGPDVQDAVLKIPARAWTPAYDISGEPRDGAQVAEITGMLGLSAWPAGSRLIVRREGPHPGAQLTFSSGHRFTAFLTDTKGGQLANLEVWHRSHARVEDRIRGQKATGLRNLPCRGNAHNKAWLELSLAAADLLTWAQALCFDAALVLTGLLYTARSYRLSRRGQVTDRFTVALERLGSHRAVRPHRRRARPGARHARLRRSPRRRDRGTHPVHPRPCPSFGSRPPPGSGPVIPGRPGGRLAPRRRSRRLRAGGGASPLASANPSKVRTPSITWTSALSTQAPENPGL